MILDRNRDGNIDFEEFLIGIRVNKTKLYPKI